MWYNVKVKTMFCDVTYDEGMETRLTKKPDLNGIIFF